MSVSMLFAVSFVNSLPCSGITEAESNQRSPFALLFHSFVGTQNEKFICLLTSVFAIPIQQTYQWWMLMRPEHLE